LDTSAYELTPLLHRGEAEAIILAEEAKADYLIVDEKGGKTPSCFMKDKSKQVGES